MTVILQMREIMLLFSHTSWNTSVLEKSCKKILQSHPCCISAGGSHLGKGRVQTLVGGTIFVGCLCVQFCSLQRTPLGMSMKTIESVKCCLPGILEKHTDKSQHWAGQRG